MALWFYRYTSKNADGKYKPKDIYYLELHRVVSTVKASAAPVRAVPLPQVKFIRCARSVKHSAVWFFRPFHAYQQIR